MWCLSSPEAQRNTSQSRELSPAPHHSVSCFSPGEAGSCAAGSHVEWGPTAVIIQPSSGCVSSDLHFAQGIMCLSPQTSTAPLCGPQHLRAWRKQRPWACSTQSPGCAPACGIWVSLSPLWYDAGQSHWSLDGLAPPPLPIGQ